MSGRRLAKKLHIRRVMPREFATFTNGALTIDCCNADDHRSLIPRPARRSFHVIGSRSDSGVRTSPPANLQARATHVSDRLSATAATVAARATAVDRPA